MLKKAKTYNLQIKRVLMVAFYQYQMGYINVDTYQHIHWLMWREIGGHTNE